MKKLISHETVQLESIADLNIKGEDVLAWFDGESMEMVLAYTEEEETRIAVWYCEHDRGFFPKGNATEHQKAIIEAYSLRCFQDMEEVMVDSMRSNYDEAECRPDYTFKGFMNRKGLSHLV